MSMVSYDPKVAPDPAAWRSLDESTAMALVSRYHRSAQCSHPPAPNPRLHAIIHVIIENQAALGEATPVAETVQRLMREGLCRHDAIHAVGSVLSEQIYELLHDKDRPDVTASIPDVDRLRSLTAESWLCSAGETDGGRDAAEQLEAESEFDPEELAADELCGAPEIGNLTDCSDDELLEGLFAAEDRLPRVVVDEILRRADRLTHALIAIVIDPRNWQVPLPAWWAPVHATFMLGAVDAPVADAALFSAMRDAKAFDCDWISQAIPAILGRRGQRVRSVLRQIAEDRDQDDTLRATALRALAATTLTDPEGSDEVFATIGRLFDDSSEEVSLRADAGNVLLDFQVETYREALVTFGRGAVKRSRGAAWEFVPFDAEDVERAFSEPRDLFHYRSDWLVFYDPEQIAARQARWVREDEERARKRGASTPAAIKVGRNDPCPCGSGKKYKKCCLG